MRYETTALPALPAPVPTPTTTPATLGLDIGTSRLVAASRSGDEYTFRTQLNAFLTLPYSRLMENTLLKEDIRHQAGNDELVIYGSDCDRFASLLRMEARRPMHRGLLNPRESNGPSVIRLLLTSLLGDQPGDGRRIYFSVPGAPADAPSDLTYHEATIKNILIDMGYNPQPINEGLAVVLAELEDNNFTGIGVSCGGGMCNVCLAYLSMPVFHFSVPKGGDFIDESAASVVGDGPTRIRAFKEREFYFNGFSADKTQQALSIYHDDMMMSVVTALKHHLSTSRNVPRLDRPIPMVISGGSAMPRGFRDRFEKLLGLANLPIAISEVRLAADPLHTTAKGALVAALAEIS